MAIRRGLYSQEGPTNRLIWAGVDDTEAVRIESNDCCAALSVALTATTTGPRCLRRRRLSCSWHCSRRCKGNERAVEDFRDRSKARGIAHQFVTRPSDFGR